MEYVKNCFYINLNERIDRKEHVEIQLDALKINYNRFSAIKPSNLQVGCSLSHLKCLEMAKEQKLEHIMIVEDDILFTNPKLFIQQCNKFFSNNINWDVLIISGNNIPPYDKIGDYSVKISRCQTTTGYIVKSHYYDKLINNIKEGINLLIQNPNEHVKYAIDKHWFSLQLRDNWYLITPLTVTQKSGYSDIEKKQINYDYLMLDLDKAWLFKTSSIRKNTSSVVNRYKV